MKYVPLLLFFLAITTANCETAQPYTAFNPPYYSQLDPRWANITLGYGPATIGSAGCLMTSVTSMMAGLGIKIGGVLPTPPDMNTWLLNNGGYEDGYGFVWQSIEKLGFKLEGFVNDTAKTIEALNSGKRVFLHVLNGRHYVLGVADNGWGYETMDPIYPGRVYAYQEVVETTIYSR